MRARPTLTFAFPFLAVRLRLQLAKVYWAIADYSAARHLLREIDDIVLHRKLGVSSRNNAVTQATTIGLLGG